MISELKTFYRIYADTRNENTGKIVAKQNDTKTRYLDITVTDNGVPVDLTGCEVRIYGRKKDGTEFYNDGTLQDAENGRCLFEATTQMLSYAGQNVNCEIVVFKDNEQILSTMPFDIFVVESLMGAGAIESSNEYGALVILYQNLYEAIDLMTTMVQNIGSPSTVAEQYNLETMWQAWEFLADYIKTDLTQMISDALANSSVNGVLNILNTITAKEDTSKTILNKIEQNDANAEKQNTKLMSVKSSQIGTGRHTILSVTGKGVINGFLIHDYITPNGNGILDMTVDGVKYTYTMSTTSNNNTIYYALVTYQNYDTYHNTFVYPFISMPSNCSWENYDLNVTNGGNHSKSLGTYGVRTWVDKEGLYFNSSFQLEVQFQHATESSATVYYSLDD